MHNYLESAGCIIETESDPDKIYDKVKEAKSSGNPYKFIVIEPTENLNLVYHKLIKCSEEIEWELERCIVIQNRTEWSQKMGNTALKFIKGNPMRCNDLIWAVAQATKKTRFSMNTKSVKNKMSVQKDTLPEKVENVSREAERDAGRLILVAEDNMTNQVVIRMQLKRLGFAADIVDNGHEALKALANEPYGLLLTDCHMPLLDGYGLAEKVRKSEENTSKHIPIIAITANALIAETDRCLNLGMDSVLHKPVKINELYETLVHWLPKDKAKQKAKAS